MAREEDALLWLCNPVSQVSAHYFIFEDGRALQLVPEARRAWHAGVSQWDGESDVNSASIGIEIANRRPSGRAAALPEAQIEALIALPRTSSPAGRSRRKGARPFRRGAGPQDRSRRSVPLGAAAPGRDRQLGAAGADPRRPLLQSRRRGLAGRGPAGDVRAVWLSLRITGAFDRETEAVVAAFQRHFRPERIDGVADASTITTLRDVIAAPGGPWRRRRRHRRRRHGR